RAPLSEPLSLSYAPLFRSRRRRQRIMALVRARLHWMLLVGLVLGGAGAALGYLSVSQKFASIGRYEINPFNQTSIFDKGKIVPRSEEHTSELQSRENLVCR